MLESDHVELWRALVATSASVSLATEAVRHVAELAAGADAPVRRVDLWIAAFDHLDAARDELRIGLPLDQSIHELSDRLHQLSIEDTRSLLGAHFARFDADELTEFALAGAGAASGGLRPSDPTEAGSGLAQAAEERMRRLDDRPVEVQFAPLDGLVPPALPRPQPPSTGRPRAAVVLAAVALVGVVAAAVAAVFGGPDDGTSAPPKPQPEQAVAPVELPRPSQCRPDEVVGALAPSPSALRAATATSFGDVLESSDRVVAGQLRSIDPEDGWVTFELVGARALDGETDGLPTSFSVPGRMLGAVEVANGLELVALVTRDSGSPTGWRTPVRGGVWLACVGGGALPVGDTAPLDQDWLGGPTLSGVEAAVAGRVANAQTMALTDLGGEAVVGGVRLRDGTGLSLRLPHAIGTTPLDVRSSEERSVTLDRGDLRIVVDLARCAEAVAADEPACSPPEVDVDADRPLSTDELDEIEVYVVDPREHRTDTVLRGAPRGGLVALDVPTLLPRWRAGDDDARPVGFADDLAVAVLGEALVAFDVATGEPAWSVPVAGADVIEPIGNSWWAVVDGGVGSSIVSIDAATGDVGWRRDAPAGVTWHRPIEAGEVAIVTERSDRSPDRLIAIGPVDGRQRWSFELAPGPAGAPVFAVDAERGIVAALDTDDGLVRLDAADGRERWRIGPIRQAAIEGIWPNSITVLTPDHRLTVGLTEGFLLPP